MLGPLQWLGLLLIRGCCWVPAPLCPSREKGQERPGDMVSPGGGTPSPVAGGFLGTGSQDFWSPCPPDQAKSQGLLQPIQSLQPLIQLCCLFHPGRSWCQPHAAPTTQGSCLSPSFIYFLENFFNILILLLVSPLNSIFCPCAPTHLIG